MDGTFVAKLNPQLRGSEEIWLEGGSAVLSKLSEVTPAIAGGLLGKKLELIGLAEGPLEDLHALGLRLNLAPKIFTHAAAYSAQGEFLGASATLEDARWLTPAGEAFPNQQLNELFVESRVKALRQLKDLPSKSLLRGELKGTTILLLLNNSERPEEMSAVVELLKLNRAAKVIPLCPKLSTDLVSSLSAVCEQLIEIS